MSSYITAFPLTDLKQPTSKVVGVDVDEHAHRLFDAKIAYDQIVGVRNHFKASKAKIENGYREGVLGAKGRRDQLHAAMEEALANLEQPRKTLAVVKDYGDKLLRGITTEPPSDKPMSLVEFRAELARGRTLERSSRLTAAERHDAIRAASEKQDYQFLGMILDEPGLVNGSIATAIQQDIARHAHPREFRQLQDLNGRLQDNGVADPLTGALPVLGFVLDETAKWLQAEADMGVEANAPAKNQ
jgi:hypothetical protein